MGFTMNFIGLVNFHDMKPSGGVVLLPDGRHPPGQIPRHDANLFVLTDNVDNAHTDWWPAVPNNALETRGISQFPIAEKCWISITGIEEVRSGGRGSTPGEDTLDTSEHRDRLARLREIDPAIHVNVDKADTIAKMWIRRGKLTGYTFNGQVNVSQLTVSSPSGPVTITARTEDGTIVKTLTVADSTEIFMTNMSDPFAHHDDEDHFRLYGRLDENRKDDLLREAPPMKDLPPLPSNHPYLLYLANGGADFPLPGCSNTGCC